MVDLRYDREMPSGRIRVPSRSGAGSTGSRPMATLKLKIPPVAVALIAAVLVWLLARATPTFQFEIPARKAVAAAFFLAGIIVIGLGVAAFRRVRTTVNPRQPHTASALVTSGIYRVTRNPMYLGMLLLLVAWAIMLAHGAAFVVLPGFVLYMNPFQIRPEEAILTGIFGGVFKEYAAKVRRWL